MLESETTTIDGHVYRVTQLPFKKGQKLLVRLFKSLGPSAAEGLTVLAKKEEGKLLDLKLADIAPSVARAVHLLTEKLSEEDLDYFTTTLGEHSELQKGPDAWLPLNKEMEFHFAGNYGAWLRWLGFALKVNYASFLAGQGGLEALIAKAKAAASLSRSASTGTPIESPPVPDTA